jgi:mono/diheme cytochrome c family protein
LSRNLRRVGLVVVSLVLLAGCQGRMKDQPRVEPYEASAFFSDGQGSRPLVANTVPREGFTEDMTFLTGMDNGSPATAIPMPVTLDVIQRGQERYNIFCAPCHGLDGDGDGIIVQRGFPSPPSYHIDRLRNASPGHFFDVMTNGFGVMFDYATQVTPADRWAIVSYIQALQLSHNAAANDLPAQDRDALVGGAPSGDGS